MDEHEIEQRLTHLENASNLYQGLTYDEWVEIGEISKATDAYIAGHPEIIDRIAELKDKMKNSKSVRPSIVKKFSTDSKA